MAILGTGGEVDFHACNVAHLRPKRAWLLNSPPVPKLGYNLLIERKNGAINKLFCSRNFTYATTPRSVEEGYSA